MNLSSIDIVIIFLYLAVIVGLGFWISKKASKNIQSYFLGDNNIKWYWLGFSNSSGMFDVSGTAFYVALLFVYGFKAAWLPWLWPIWNQIFVMVFLAIWIRRSNAMTGADWIIKRFGDDRGGRLAHIIVVLFAIVSVIGFIGYVFVGIGKFSATILPWDLSNPLLSSQQTYAVIIVALTTLYTVKGGMYSVVATEVLQYGILLVSCVLVVTYAVHDVNYTELHHRLPEGWNNFWPTWKLDVNWSNSFPQANQKVAEDGFTWFGALVMMMIAKGVFSSLAGPVPGFDMQRILSAKKPKEAAMLTGFTNLVLYIPLFMMVSALTLIGINYFMPVLQAQQKPDFEVILSKVVGGYLPAGVRGVVLAGLLASFMSTFSAFVNAAPAYLVNDFYKKYFKPNEAPSHYVKWSYVTSIAVIVTGCIFGLFADSLSSLTLWISSALYGGYAAANVLKWIWWRFNGYGYFAGMLTGLISATFVPKLMGLLATAYFPQYADLFGSGIGTLISFFIILAFSMTGSVLGCLLTPAPSQQVLTSFYANTRPWGWWKPVARWARAADPDFIPNRQLKWDILNILIGICWQMSMVIMPVCFVFGYFEKGFLAMGTWLACMVVLKFTWYDRLYITAAENTYIVHREAATAPIETE
ncbi:Na+:solute symporter [Chitinophaga polysaccharea]|uniref:sodium:solute symporter family protein n=1 Tax=Chitinophaga polysaccharea TaxID=1293035 RepID=UPI001455353F|nr:sodium:solute symporter family protein [Chitinophaga polysaccharea]NLR62275.1 Na+:solute symporter [Chitinophaga polysaccharea]